MLVHKRSGWMLLVLTLSAMCLLVPNASAARKQTVAQSLEVSKPIERELSGGQSHVYEITLTAGQYLNAVVEQRGIARCAVAPAQEPTAQANRTGSNPAT